MHTNVRVFLMTEDNQRFFGDGPYDLLKGIDETGSLRKSSAAMGMAYSKAIRIIHKAEEALGFPITIRKIGGKMGGGSQLTKEAKEFMEKYELYRDSCSKKCNEIYNDIFS